VIVEAVGDDYSNVYGYVRASASTGLPTILGLQEHQWVWRGWEYEDTRGRREDVDRIYESEELDEVEALLEEYDVTYVYVGREENKKYGSEVGERFDSFMDVVFENEEVTIYRVRE